MESKGFPGSSAGKESTCNAGDPRFDSWVRKIPWRRDRLPTLVSLGFPRSSVGKESTCHTGDLGSVPGLGRSPGGGQPAPVSILAWRISMDRGAWQTTVHGVAKSQTRQSNFAHTHDLTPCWQMETHCPVSWMHFPGQT